MENLKIPQNIPWPENVPVIRDRVVCMAEPHLAEGHHCQHWPAKSLKGDQRWALIKVTTGGSEESSSSCLWSSLDTWSVQSREFRTGCRRRGQSRLDSPLPFEEVWMCVWSPSDPFLCGKLYTPVLLARTWKHQQSRALMASHAVGSEWIRRKARWTICARNCRLDWISHLTATAEILKRTNNKQQITA